MATTHYRHARQWLRKLCGDQAPFRLKAMGSAWVAVQCGSGECHAIELTALIETGSTMPLGIQEVMQKGGWGPKLVRMLERTVPMTPASANIIRILEEFDESRLDDWDQEEPWLSACDEIQAIRAKDHSVWEPGHLGQIQVAHVTAENWPSPKGFPKKGFQF